MRKGVQVTPREAMLSSMLRLPLVRLLALGGARGCLHSRRVTNSEQVTQVASLAMISKPSVDFSGYWQRHAA